MTSSNTSRAQTRRKKRCVFCEVKRAVEAGREHIDLLEIGLRTGRSLADDLKRPRLLREMCPEHLQLVRDVARSLAHQIEAVEKGNKSVLRPRTSRAPRQPRGPRGADLKLVRKKES